MEPNGTRGPVTPPDPVDNQNGLNDENFDEPDLTAQQEMRTPSPVDEEFQLMEQNNEIFKETNPEFIESDQETKMKCLLEEEPLPEEPMLTELENDQTEEIEEGESVRSPDHHEKRRKKKHRKTSESGDGNEKSSGRKRRHSPTNEEKKLEKLREMKFGSGKSSGGQDTRRFNFRETESSTPDKKSTTPNKDTTPLRAAIKDRRGGSPDPLSYYRAETISHPVVKAFRDMKTLPIPGALDILFSINPQDVAVLTKTEMLEILDILFDLNRRREQLTINRMRLTDEVRRICSAEISLLNDLTHLMNPEERHFFEQLKQCPPSMDELEPFDPRMAPADIDLTRGITRLYAVDLLPPPETPLLGRHDPNWDTFLKHIPQQFRGVAPPPSSIVHESKPQSFPPPQNLIQQMTQPPPNFVSPAPPLQSLVSLGSVVPASVAPIVSTSTIREQQIVSQPLPVSITQPSFSQPPPNFTQTEIQPQFSQQQQQIAGGFPQASAVEMVPSDVKIQTVPLAQTSSGLELISSDQHVQQGQSIAPPLITSVPPPIIQQKPPSSLAPIDTSIPPPVFSSIEPTREQLSPISAFRSSLKSSLLNSLVTGGSGPSQIAEQPPPLMAPPQSGPPMSYLTPPSMAGPSGSPQRFPMHPPGQSPQRPFPLMSIETTKPFIPPTKRHGRSGGDKQNQRRGGRALKNQKNLESKGSEKEQQNEDATATESPSSPVPQSKTTTTTTVESYLIEESQSTNQEGENT